MSEQKVFSAKIIDAAAILATSVQRFPVEERLSMLVAALSVVIVRGGMFVPGHDKLGAVVADLVRTIEPMLDAFGEELVLDRDKQMSGAFEKDGRGDGEIGERQ